MKTAFGDVSAMEKHPHQPAPSATASSSERTPATEPASALKDAVALYAREPSEANASRVELAIAAVRRQRAPSRTRATTPRQLSRSSL